MAFTGKFSVVEELVHGEPVGYRLVSSDGYESQRYSHTAKVLQEMKKWADMRNGIWPESEYRTVY